MEYARPLPSNLVKRYHGWKATTFEESKSFYQQLATEGQRPRAMVIACCDSRVLVTQLFGADQGDFFLHRNIANLVPPYQPDGNQHGTSAAIEYAVNHLKVSHMIIVGHSGCGGVDGCYQMCNGNAPELEEKSSFIGRWMDILRPGFERLPEGDEATQKTALEKIGVLVSMENLMTFPFVKKAVESENLMLHGLWHDLKTGDLEAYDPTTEKFAGL